MSGMDDREKFAQFRKYRDARKECDEEPSSLSLSELMLRGEAARNDSQLLIQQVDRAIEEAVRVGIAARWHLMHPIGRRKAR